MQTLVKLMLRLTTYVTTSPTCRRRSSSATRVRAWRSRPTAAVSEMPSSTESSWASRTPTRMRRTPRDGERTEQVRERRLGLISHRDARLRAEVLDDDLLDVTVPLVEVADRCEGVHPLALGLADADENARRERDRELPRERDRSEAPRRYLVGRAVVRQAGAAEPLRHGLEHQAHAHGDLAEGGEVALGHHPRVGVGQERRLAERELADRAEVAERGAVTVATQELAVAGEGRLGPVTEREQGFLRPEPRAGPGEGQHFLGRHRMGAGLPGIAAEGAVAAVVATQGRQRHEDLGGEGDDSSPATVAHLARASEELVEPRVGRLDERARLGM